MDINQKLKPLLGNLDLSYPEAQCQINTENLMVSLRKSCVSNEHYQNVSSIAKSKSLPLDYVIRALHVGLDFNNKKHTDLLGLNIALIQKSLFNSTSVKAIDVQNINL